MSVDHLVGRQGQGRGNDVLHNGRDMFHHRGVVMDQRGGFRYNSVESIDWISCVVHGTDGTVRFHQRVLTCNGEEAETKLCKKVNERTVGCRNGTKRNHATSGKGFHNSIGGVYRKPQPRLRSPQRSDWFRSLRNNNATSGCYS